MRVNGETLQLHAVYKKPYFVLQVTWEFVLVLQVMYTASKYAMKSKVRMMNHYHHSSKLYRKQMHTRNNTDGNKLMIFSSTPLYYGDTGIFPFKQGFPLVLFPDPQQDLGMRPGSLHELVLVDLKWMVWRIHVKLNWQIRWMSAWTKLVPWVLSWWSVKPVWYSWSKEGGRPRANQGWNRYVSYYTPSALQRFFTFPNMFLKSDWLFTVLLNLLSWLLSNSTSRALRVMNIA